MNAWVRYWFAPAPCFDLAVVRIIACAVTLFFILIFENRFTDIAGLAALPDENYRPVLMLKLLLAPFGWGHGADGVWAVRPGGTVVASVMAVCVVSGLLSMIGLFTRISLFFFAASFVFVTAFLYSFGDFHHPAQVMAVALTALALSPAGRVLSIDWLRGPHRGEDQIEVVDRFAGWPLKLIQWFFVLMYWSAVLSKMDHGGFDWANGYTLQWYLARDGLLWGSDLGVWMSGQHILVLLGQIGVLLFQATFFLCILFPVLRWLYVPAGLGLHSSIYLLLRAPFFTWIALYSVFIPWSALVRRLRRPQMSTMQG